MKKLDINIYLSVATIPVLIGFLAIRATAKALGELGEKCEEVFRGDRLPLLHFPEKGKEKGL
jgi:hypothetical protein